MNFATVALSRYKTATSFHRNTTVMEPLPFSLFVIIIPSSQPCSRVSIHFVQGLDSVWSILGRRLFRVLIESGLFWEEDSPSRPPSIFCASTPQFSGVPNFKECKTEPLKLFLDLIEDSLPKNYIKLLAY